MEISKHITYEEATKSATALRNNIDNTPAPGIVHAMETVAKECFEPLREWYEKPIKIDSFYRCAALNRMVGGSATSQHVKGEAIDMDAGNKQENKKLFDWCKAHLVYDQLIWEYGDESGPDWVHISFRAGQNRNEALNIK
jgi:hypothetical protein